jgi:hypothetical protein
MPARRRFVGQGHCYFPAEYNGGWVECTLRLRHETRDWLRLLLRGAPKLNHLPPARRSSRSTSQIGTTTAAPRSR